ncbi:hypothetical protein FB451DRAFT_731249 [Mycena latifolia]|nr:hypothetical protein FB451DRAFT_731249 [Mycena latifolia]
MLRGREAPAPVDAESAGGSAGAQKRSAVPEPEPEKESTGTGRRYRGARRDGRRRARAPKSQSQSRDSPAPAAEENEPRLPRNLRAANAAAIPPPASWNRRRMTSLRRSLSSPLRRPSPGASAEAPPSQSRRRTTRPHPTPPHPSLSPPRSPPCPRSARRGGARARRSRTRRRTRSIRSGTRTCSSSQSCLHRRGAARGRGNTPPALPVPAAPKARATRKGAVPASAPTAVEVGAKENTPGEEREVGGPVVKVRVSRSRKIKEEVVEPEANTTVPRRATRTRTRT